MYNTALERVEAFVEELISEVDDPPTLWSGALGEYQCAKYYLNLVLENINSEK